MRYEEHVLPDAALERLGRVGCQAAEVCERTACDWILVAPCTVLVFGLEEASEVCVCAVDEGLLVWLEEVLPVACPRKVDGVCFFAEGFGEGEEIIVVVAMLH